MSTETTNKKIKIDNGTTFGRTYTDKAVDELLKGVGGQKVYTCAITDLLSISDIQNLIGVITSSQSSTAKKYNLLKSIDDIINEYDYIYVDTSALQMAGGLTFRKQINAGNNKNFALCYGYFNFDSSSNKISSFANIVISLSDAWYVETISNLTLLPNVDGTGANNGKVLTFDTNSLGTNGVPYKWAEVGGEGGVSVIELTDKNGTIASTQLGEINANPQNFAFKYNGNILLFTSADSSTYQYCNNTTSSSDNNVMTTSTLLTITSSTGAYTIAENVHNVVANSIHPANGGDLTNIQVGSKVYSIPSGGGGSSKITITATESDWTGSGSIPSAYWSSNRGRALKPNTSYEVGDNVTVLFTKSFNTQYLQENQIIVPCSSKTSLGYANYTLKFGDVILVLTDSSINLRCSSSNNKNYNINATTYLTYTVVKAGTTGADVSLPSNGWDCTYSYIIYTLGISAA